MRTLLGCTIAISALLGTYLLLTVFVRCRRLSDLMLAIAALTLALVTYPLIVRPGLDGARALTADTEALLDGELIISIALAAVAFVPTERLPGGRLHRIGIGLIGIVAILALAAVVQVVTGAPWATHHSSAMETTTLGQTFSLSVRVMLVALLALCAAAFLFRSRPRDENAALLAGVSFLLLGSVIYDIAASTIAGGSGTLGWALQLAAFSLLAAVPFRRDTRMRADMEWEVVIAERERIARDLHDGLAQDLAVIAAHGPDLLAKLGPGHPIVVAAKRSLAASRGAIADLSASAAPTTAAAIREIADELEARFGVMVEVSVSGNPQQDLRRRVREEVVRIVREAIVNAARHGRAQQIEVELYCRGRDLLRVTDDGGGITAASSTAEHGFGLATMRARAESIGARLVTRPAPHGGTQLEVIFARDRAAHRARQGRAGKSQALQPHGGDSTAPQPNGRKSQTPRPDLRRVGT